MKYLVLCMHVQKCVREYLKFKFEKKRIAKGRKEKKERERENCKWVQQKAPFIVHTKYSQYFSLILHHFVVFNIYGAVNIKQFFLRWKSFLGFERSFV